MAKSKEIKEKATEIVRGSFNLGNFKKKKGFANASVKFKSQEWIPLSKAFQDITSLPGIPTGHITLLRGHSDTGKAQPLSSKVLTPTGWVEMGEIGKGDLVVGSDGKAKEVLGVYPQGVLDKYKVYFSDDTSVECCGEHLWEVESYRDRCSNHGRASRLSSLNRTNEFYIQKRVITTKEILETLYVTPSPKKNPEVKTKNYRVPIVAPVDFNQEGDLPIKPYTLGALIGDGSLKGNCAITSVDEYIINRVKKELPEHMKLSGPYGDITYGITTEDLQKGNDYRRAIKMLGLDVTSESKFIPDIYKYASISSRTDLLHGLMDTDGYISQDGTNAIYNTVSRRLAEDVAELVRSLGHVAKITFVDNKYKGCYGVYITDNGHTPICSLPRKVERHKPKTKYPASKYIVDVELIGKEEQQCIYIDSPDHLYVTDGYTLTHNTTALLEAAVNAQKAGILPVFIISEMKWSWEHAKEMGLEFEEVKDENGNVVDYEGHFLYADRGTLNTIEEVAVHMADLLDEQAKGNLPYDLCFFWDSIGSIPCELSVRSNKNNNEWNAGAMSTQFGNNLNQKILLSRKENSPYTNTLVAINKVWTMKPESPMSQPKLQNKGGMSMWYDATLVVTFGNITNPGTSKIKAVKNGLQVEFAKRTNVQIEKNHIGGVQSRGRIVMTTHGFIPDDPKAIEKYKNQYKEHWLKLVGSIDFDLVEEGDMEEERITPNILD